QEGVPPVGAPVSAAPRRHDVEVPRDVRDARPDGPRDGNAAARSPQPRGRGARHQPLHPRLAAPHRHVEDPGPEAGARAARLRRRVRRRPPRRGEVAREGAHLLLPQRPAPLGPEEPAARAVEGVQRPQAPGRVDPGLSAVELDRARHLAVHLPRECPGRAALLRGAAAGGRAQRHPDHGRRRAHAAAPRRGSGAAQGALPHARLLPSDRSDRVRRRHAAGADPGDAAHAHLGAPGPDDRPRHVGLDGEEEAGGLLLMAHVSDLIATNIERYLAQHEQKSLLRFITCGSVDDGKSTLIGRLLYESKMLFEDQLAAVEADSRKWGTQGGDIDFALLVDGLAAEREQGITIDVAYRFFSTDRRKFIVADTPGHEQYTRNMITGASTADLAIILVDARK